MAAFVRSYCEAGSSKSWARRAPLRARTAGRLPPERSVYGLWRGGSVVRSRATKGVARLGCLTRKLFSQAFLDGVGREALQRFRSRFFGRGPMRFVHLQRLAFFICEVLRKALVAREL